MRRRNFILLTIAGTSAWMASSCNTHGTATLSRPLFLSAICDLPTLRHIGAGYRKLIPAEADRAQLIDLLTTNLPPGGDQAQQIDSKVRQDYAAGRTVTIDGWVISVTEARQCALYSLQTP